MSVASGASVRTSAADMAACTATVHRMGWLADQRRWDELAALFTTPARIDYTALTGGEPAAVDPREVVDGWSASLGALDATQHLVGSVLVDLDDDVATATAQFQATHTFDDDAWTLGGHYRFGLARGADGWRISAVTMTPTWSTGDPDLVARAVAAGNAPAALARAFLDGLSAMDVDAALSVFADDAVQEMPYAPAGFPDRLEGIAALRRQYGGLPDAFASMRFVVDRVVASGDVAVLEYHGEVELTDGRRYDNDYAGIFEARDGRLVRFVERFDPIVLVEAFGDSVDETFSIGDG